MTPLEEAIHHSQKRSRTKKIYLCAVQGFIGYAGDSSHDWTPRSLESWRRKRLAQGVSARTVNLELAGIKYASKRLADLSGDSRQDFARAVERMKEEDDIKKRKALTQEQVGALLATCDEGRPIDIRDRAILTVGIRTGMRREALASMKFEHFENRAIWIRLKGGRKHLVRLDSITVKALGEWMSWLKEEGRNVGYVFRALGRESVEGFLHLGDNLSVDGIYIMIKRRAKVAGVRKVSPHVLRHTFVSWCKQLGVPDYRIREITGHRSNAMIDLYTTDLEADTKPVGEMLPWV